MNYFILIFAGLFFHQITFAKEICWKISLDGFIKKNKNNYFLEIASESTSRKEMIFESISELQSYPYLNQFVSGEFILKDQFNKTNKIIKISTILRTPYHPLGAQKIIFANKEEKIQCPY